MMDHIIKALTILAYTVGGGEEMLKQSIHIWHCFFSPSANCYIASESWTVQCMDKTLCMLTIFICFKAMCTSLPDGKKSHCNYHIHSSLPNPFFLSYAILNGRWHTEDFMRERFLHFSYESMKGS